MATNENTTRQERLARLSGLRAEGIEPYAASYSRSHTAAQLQDLYPELPANTETTDVVRLCGRIMNERNTWMFVDLFDESGRIQLFCHRDNLGQEQFQRLRRLLHRGDFIGVEGTVRRTRAGELTVRVTSLTVLSVALNNLPGQQDGFTDVESRLRQRHLDMIMNRGVMDTLRRRSLTVRYLRQYLDDRGFLEFETPVLQTQAGGAHARPFVTHHNVLDMPMYLRIATELHLKRLIVGGFERVYEIGRIFRNEGMSTRHNPEFTSLELYQAYGDYNQLMDLTEGMLRDVAVRITGGAMVTCQGVELNFAQPFTRVTMVQSVAQVTGVNFDTIRGDDSAARQAARGIGVEVANSASWGQCLNAVFEERVEATLVQPTFVVDYPIEISPLARRHQTQEGLVERFELFAMGRELANGYSELVDPVDQRQRMEEQARQRDAGDHEAHSLDIEFIEALECGMPPTMGVGIGIDRLVMLITDSASIRDVIAFPTLRPTTGS